MPYEIAIIIHNLLMRNQSFWESKGLIQDSN